ncbi:CBS domain-containing protein [Clostridium niameyense]|uniref:CBS domain-containing protein n=1 Tax=Clostridium niameyense TaxID=1622073 RepID=UPI00067E8CAC|nr:CBS domain-containing protein [Clostridium niameyense]
MNIDEVMSKDVATLNREDTVQNAAELMSKYNVGSVPVCNGEKVIGIITDRDIALRAVATGKNSANLKVSDIMTSNPVVANTDMDIQDAARIMSERQIRRLPVEDNGKISGIVALGDIAVDPNCSHEAQEALSDISEQNN